MANEKGLEFIEPLHYWSELNRLAAELHLEAGKSFAYAVSGQVRVEAVLKLQDRVREIGEALVLAATKGSGRASMPTAEK